MLKLRWKPNVTHCPTVYDSPQNHEALAAIVSTLVRQRHTTQPVELTTQVKDSAILTSMLIEISLDSLFFP